MTALNSIKECSQHYIWIFQTLKGRKLRCWWWDLAETQIHPSFYSCPCYLQESWKIHPKIKALECSQHFSNYKSMEIFPDAQGQLTLSSLVGLFVWFDSLCPINNLSVIKGQVFLGWTSTKLGLMFLLKDTTQWHLWGSNLLNFKPVWDFMVVLVTCKNEEAPIKIGGAWVLIRLTPL